MDIDIQSALCASVRKAMYEACEPLDNYQLILTLCAMIGETIITSGKGDTEETIEFVSDLIRSYLIHAAETLNG